VIFGSAQNVVDRCRSSKAYCCRNATPFSLSCHGCRMKRLSTARILCAPARSVSGVLPFYKPGLSTFSTLALMKVSRVRQLFISCCRLSCSAAQLQRISTPYLPTIEFAWGRVRRNRRRLPSNGVIERAQNSVLVRSSS
jgi:hypothetical protein